VLLVLLLLWLLLCCCYVVVGGGGGGVSNGVGSDGGLVVFITTWRSRLERGGHFEREE